MYLSAVVLVWWCCCLLFTSPVPMLMRERARANRRGKPAMMVVEMSLSRATYFTYGECMDTHNGRTDSRPWWMGTYSPSNTYGATTTYYYFLPALPLGGFIPEYCIHRSMYVCTTRTTPRNMAQSYWYGVFLSSAVDGSFPSPSPSGPTRPPIGYNVLALGGLQRNARANKRLQGGSCFFFFSLALARVRVWMYRFGQGVG